MEAEDARIGFIIQKEFQRLEIFTLADNLEEFVNWQTYISELCFDYDEISDETIVRMSETEFYSLVNDSYLQFQKVFPILSCNNLLYEELIYRWFKMLTLIIVSEIVLVSFYLSMVS